MLPYVSLLELEAFDPPLISRIAVGTTLLPWLCKFLNYLYMTDFQLLASILAV